MALIDVKKLQRVDGESHNPKDAIRGTYQMNEHNGERYFAIKTYGREGREYPDSSSQTFHSIK